MNDTFSEGNAWSSTLVRVISCLLYWLYLASWVRWWYSERCKAARTIICHYKITVIPFPKNTEFTATRSVETVWIFSYVWVISMNMTLNSSLNFMLCLCLACILPWLTFQVGIFSLLSLFYKKRYAYYDIPICPSDHVFVSPNNFWSNMSDLHKSYTNTVKQEATPSVYQKTNMAVIQTYELEVTLALIYSNKIFSGNGS